MGNCCSAISTKGKGCPHGWKGVALSPSERVCQTDLPFFSVLLADKEINLIFCSSERVFIVF